MPKHRYSFLLVLAVLILSAFFLPGEWKHLLSQLGDRDRVVDLLSGFGPAGPFLLSLLLLLQVFLAWIPGHALMIAGGLVYGFKTAFLITAAMTILGSQLAFLLARHIGRPVVERFVPLSILGRWEGAAARQGILFFLMTFWLPVFPSDMMCFLAGLGKISPKRFFIANFFGRLPCAALLVLLGSHVFELPAYTWVALAVAAGVSLGIWKLYERFSRRPTVVTI